MRNRLAIALVLVASLLLVVPAVSASEVVDPVIAKLESILATLVGVRDQSTALTQRVEALEKQVAEIHKTVVPAEAAKPETLIIKSDGITPISVAQTEDWGTYELIGLKEEGSSVIARIRVRTPSKKAPEYRFYLESGRARFVSDYDVWQSVPAATTREFTLTFKNAAGTLTPEGYISVNVRYYGEPTRIYLAPQK
ncbi:hypothetical protein [Symbiobacterium terraclitae]|uniref:hypothetical protein n=1 Tax=Symbiobacterium terraclitae TaxID=557451 RepID=UPI0035B55E5F